MATFKTCVFKNHLRQDGTYNIKLRVIHHRESRKISTPFYVEKRFVTPKLEITDSDLVNRCDDLCYECRKICRELGFAIERMTVDDVVRFLEMKLKGEDGFRLDFCRYWFEQAKNMSSGTGGLYIAALHAFQRFIGRDTCDIMQITSHLVDEFKTFLEREPSQCGSNRKRMSKSPIKAKTRAISSYLHCMRAIYNRAKLQFNDEDTGVIPLSRSPFSKVKLSEPIPQKRAVPPAVIQSIIDLPDRPDGQPGARRYNLAKDCFLLSFGLIGINSADLYSCERIDRGILTYNRQKTCTRRADRAEMKVQIEPVLNTLIEKYRDVGKGRQFRFYLDYATKESFNRAINRGLRMIAEELGLSSLQYYAARHSWATIARSRQCNIEKATVHEALNHTDSKMQITDRYIDKDWTVIWEANRKVLSLFKWPEK